MPTTYRLILMALSALALTGAAPAQTVTDQSAKVQRVEGTQLSKIAEALEKANEAAKTDNGCKAGQDDRSSDLCAQWKAADAAADSAGWTGAAFWATVVGVVIGGATLLAAIAAAVYARNAASAAERAIQTGRAWVLFHDVSIGPAKNITFPWGVVCNGAHAKIIFKNRGASPALNCAVFISHQISENRPDNPPAFVREPRPSDKAILGQGADATTNPIFLDDIQTTNWKVGKLNLFLYGLIYYNDIHSKIERISEVCIAIAYIGGSNSEVSPNTVSISLVGTQNNST